MYKELNAELRTISVEIELDYGRKYEDGVVTDENEEDIDMRSAEKLYEYLSQNTF